MTPHGGRQGSMKANEMMRRKASVSPLALAGTAILMGASFPASPSFAQTSSADAGARTNYVLEIMSPGPPEYPLDQSFLHWPLPPGEERYGRIDGRQLKTYVDALAQMSRDYRDQGHQYWGRIMGTSADAESARWMAERFRQIGLENVRLQPFDVPETILPKSWSALAEKDGKSYSLSSALPIGKLIETAPQGTSAEAVYVGLGEAADFAGRDVAGKAVFIFAVPTPSSFFSSTDMNGAVERADKAGAAAIFVSFGLPGNISAKMLLRSERSPLFVIGQDDGNQVRSMIEAGGRAPLISYALKTEKRRDLKTSQVWGVLPGQTDENIYVLAHRDGYFEGALDNGSGVATMLGLAEFFAGVPKAARRRTIVFLGTPGHHDPRFLGTGWLHENRAEVFAKTALLINAEHTAYVDAVNFMGELRKSNAIPAFNWHVGGSGLLTEISTSAFRKFGVPLMALPDKYAPGEVGRISQDAPMVQIISGAWPYHSSADVAENIPPSGLEASTRAFAKIIDEVNKHSIGELQATSTIPRPTAPKTR